MQNTPASMVQDNVIKTFIRGQDEAGQLTQARKLLAAARSTRGMRTLAEKGAIDAVLKGTPRLKGSVGKRLLADVPKGTKYVDQGMGFWKDPTGLSKRLRQTNQLMLGSLEGGKASVRITAGSNAGHFARQAARHYSNAVRRWTIIGDLVEPVKHAKIARQLGKAQKTMKGAALASHSSKLLREAGVSTTGSKAGKGGKLLTKSSKLSKPLLRLAKSLPIIGAADDIVRMGQDLQEGDWRGFIAHAADATLDFTGVGAGVNLAVVGVDMVFDTSGDDAEFTGIADMLIGESTESEGIVGLI